MTDEREPVDEWVRVGMLLGDGSGILQSRTRLGRLLRRAVVLASDPDVDDETLDAIRRFTNALEAASEEQLRRVEERCPRNR